MKSIFILVFAVLCGQTSFAHKGINVPEPVKTAFAKSYAGALRVKWEQEGDQYEVSFLYKANKMSVLYTANGSAEATETEISVKELPPPALRFASERGKVKEAARIVMADGTIKYEAEVKGSDLLFDENGNLLPESKI